MTSDWIHSVYFRTLHIRYRVLNRGYIGNPADHKIRAVVKDIVQSQSPCLDRRHMVCNECSRREDCIFFHFVVEQAEFGAYIVQVDDPAEWRGPMEPCNEQGLNIRLIGQRAVFTDPIAECVKLKPLISFDAAGDERVRFELVSVEDRHAGREIGVEDIIEDYKSRGVWDGGAVSGLRIDFVTPVEIRRKGRIIGNPKDMTFHVYLGALLERIRGVAKVHCGFKGNMPSFKDIVSPDAKVIADNRGLVFASRKPRGKGCTGEKKVKEYFGGLKGALLFKGNLTPYFPLILLGEALHIGKKTTQGLGQYVIRDISSCEGFHITDHSLTKSLA